MIIYEIVLFLMLFSGSMLVMFAAMGVIRFPNSLCRAHALGKASSLGICLILGGLWMALDDEVSGLKILLIMVFSLVTVPMAGHLVALYLYNLQGLEVTLQPHNPVEGDKPLCGPNQPDAEPE